MWRSGLGGAYWLPTSTMLPFLHPAQSGRTVARSGLRMMPTIPSPLSFRTAGFPQYGWKAGISDSAFPGSNGIRLLPAFAVGRLVCLCPSRTS